MRALLVVAAAAALACGSRTPPIETAPAPLAVDAAAADESGPTCASARDCPAGHDCAGPEGCEVPWTCQPARPCTRDAVEYCSCEGETVVGSSRCPPVPYRHRGACVSEPSGTGSAR